MTSAEIREESHLIHYLSLLLHLRGLSQSDQSITIYWINKMTSAVIQGYEGKKLSPPLNYLYIDSPLNNIDSVHEANKYSLENYSLIFAIYY